MKPTVTPSRATLARILAPNLAPWIATHARVASSGVAARYCSKHTARHASAWQHGTGNGWKQP